MYLLRNAQFFNKNSSILDGGVKGSVLLNNDFYYSFTLFETFTVWKEIDELEELYSNEQIEEMEKELLCIYKRARIPVIRNKRVHFLIANMALQ